MLRNDLDPDTSRSARPILVHRAIAGSPGLQKVAQFGAPVGPGPLSGFVTDSGLRPRYPAVEIYRVAARWPAIPPRPTSPTPTSWPASTAGPKCCCASTNAGGCQASRRWVRC